MAEQHACFVADVECNKDVTNRCQELAFQSWQMMIQMNQLRELPKI